MKIFPVTEAVVIVDMGNALFRSMGSVALNHSIAAPIVTENKSYNEIVSDFQRQLISQTMEENDNVWAKAARQLQLDRGNLYRQAKRLGLT